MSDKSTLGYMSALSGIAIKELVAAAAAAPWTYKMYRKKKRRGGERMIFHPSKRTKTLQYLLIHFLFSKLPVHGAAHGYVKGLVSPLRKNAEHHAKNAFLLKTDFTDFFPSIQPVDVLRVIKKHSELLDFTINAADEKFLTGALFTPRADAKLGLAIGAPSSPIISNVVMFELDAALSKVAESHGAKYSRYADDLVFSTNEKGVSAVLLKEIKVLLKTWPSPKLELHVKKTVLASRGSRRSITGLTISNNGTISIGRKKKRSIRSLLYLFDEGKLNEKQKARLIGLLAYIKDVDPLFMDDLIVRYSMETIERLYG